MINWSIIFLRSATAITVAGIIGSVYGHLTNEFKIKNHSFQLVREEIDFEEDEGASRNAWEKFRLEAENREIANICKRLVNVNRGGEKRQQNCQDWVVGRMESLFHLG